MARGPFASLAGFCGTIATAAMVVGIRFRRAPGIAFAVVALAGAAAFSGMTGSKGESDAFLPALYAAIVFLSAELALYDIGERTPITVGRPVGRLRPAFTVVSTAAGAVLAFAVVKLASVGVGSSVGLAAVIGAGLAASLAMALIVALSRIKARG
ncbi:MAG TPA: hypothetical protein VGS21_03215 [Acidimicrobiales bacterium]|nr:hypothetical protein [Acidimicrobiales bacterium]